VFSVVFIFDTTAVNIQDGAGPPAPAPRDEMQGLASLDRGYRS
jgi:hypothetical protein